MIRQRMRRAALEYAARGWPVVPASAYHVERANMLATSYSLRCACPVADRCSQPGAHPADADWREHATTDERAVQRWWSAQPHRNVLLETGLVLDAWLAPPRIGALATELLRAEPLRPAVARTAAGDWLFLTRPAGDRASLDRLGVRRLGQGQYVAAPPSWHGNWRRDRWVVPPADTLPFWEPVAMVLWEAAYRLEISPVADSVTRVGA